MYMFRLGGLFVPATVPQLKIGGIRGEPLVIVFVVVLSSCCCPIAYVSVSVAVPIPARFGDSDGLVQLIEKARRDWKVMFILRVLPLRLKNIKE